MITDDVFGAYRFTDELGDRLEVKDLKSGRRLPVNAVSVRWAWYEDESKLMISLTPLVRVTKTQPIARLEDDLPEYVELHVFRTVKTISLDDTEGLLIVGDNGITWRIKLGESTHRLYFLDLEAVRAIMTAPNEDPKRLMDYWEPHKVED